MASILTQIEWQVFSRLIFREKQVSRRHAFLMQQFRLYELAAQEDTYSESASQVGIHYADASFI